jgi:hypothetical protein
MAQLRHGLTADSCTDLEKEWACFNTSWSTASTYCIKQHSVRLAFMLLLHNLVGYVRRLIPCCAGAVAARCCVNKFSTAESCQAMKTKHLQCHSYVAISSTAVRHTRIDTIGIAAFITSNPGCHIFIRAGYQEPPRPLLPRPPPPPPQPVAPEPREPDCCSAARRAGSASWKSRRTCALSSRPAAAHTYVSTAC